MINCLTIRYFVYLLYDIQINEYCTFWRILTSLYLNKYFELDIFSICYVFLREKYVKKDSQSFHSHHIKVCGIFWNFVKKRNKYF